MNCSWCKGPSVRLRSEGMLDMSFFVSDAAVAELMHMDDSTEQELEAEGASDMSEMGLNKDNAAALETEAINFLGSLDLESKEEMEGTAKIILNDVQAKENEVLAEANEEEALEDEQIAVEDEMLAEEDLEAAQEDEKNAFMGGAGDDSGDADYWAEKKALMSRIPLCHK